MRFVNHMIDLFDGILMKKYVVVFKNKNLQKLTLIVFDIDLQVFINKIFK